jgi:hypothetical protein
MPVPNKGNNKITEYRAIFQRERQNSTNSQQTVNKQTKSVNNWKTGKTAMAQKNCDSPENGHVVVC